MKEHEAAIPLVVAAVLTVATFAGAVVPEQASRPPSIVLFLTDTVRADQVGAYGWKRDTTPVFDALAERGVLFEDAYAPSSWTRPSVASLFTGRFPQRHGVEMREDNLPEEIPTLAERLRDRGLQTVAVTTNPHVTETWGMTRGFDRVVQLMSDPDTLKAGNNAFKVYSTVKDLVPGLREPFFLYVHLIDPHWPYSPPEADMKALRLDPATERSRQLYNGELHFADRNIGRMLETLGGAGLLDDAIVVSTADHGEELRDHGRLGHGSTLYQEVVKIPLALELPRRLKERLASDARCRRVSATVSLVDLMPTLLDLSEVRPPPGMDGRSLVADMRCQETPERPLFFSVAKEKASLAGLLVGPSKMIVDRETEKRELYFLDSDPREHSPVAATPETEDLVESLATTLEAFEWSARPGIHVMLSGRDGDQDRRELTVRLKTTGRFVDVETHGFERSDRMQQSQDGSFIRIDAVLRTHWHRSPIHVWVQDRDAITFDVEPPDAEVSISVRRDGERAPTRILKHPRATSLAWPQTFTMRELAGDGRLDLIDTRRPGVYLFAQRPRPPRQRRAVSPEIAAALRALGYVQ